MQRLVEDVFIPISIATLLPNSVVGIPLYIHDARDGQMRLYRGAEVGLEQSDLLKLQLHGVTKLFVRTGEHAEYQAYLRGNLPRLLADETCSIQKRFALLGGVVRDVLSTAFRRSNPDEIVDVTHQLAEHSVDLICREDSVASELLGVMYHDYHTFTHSANVSYFCVMLAKSLRITDREELRQIASGALLHDIGKLDIPESILCKPGRLDDREFNVIKNHPRTGFLALSHREDLTRGQLMMVYQHHERLNGKGYPVGHVDADIHPWAKLCSVVDVFEALTSNRPYRAGMPIAKALSILQRDSGRALDEEMVRCWRTTISCV